MSTGAAWNKAHPEAMRAAAMRYWWKHHDRLMAERRSEKHREYKRKWREKNRAKLIAADRARYWKDPEERRATAAKYRKENKNSIKEYRAKNIDFLRKAVRKSYHKHKERNREHTREWTREHYRKNRDHIIARQSARIHRKRANGGSYTVKQWDALKKKYKYQCLRCLRIEPEIRLTADHVIPVNCGGSNNIENIQPLCKSCNSIKHDMTIDYRKSFGLVLDPRTIPVQRSLSIRFSGIQQPPRRKPLRPLP